MYTLEGIDDLSGVPHRPEVHGGIKTTEAYVTCPTCKATVPPIRISVRLTPSGTNEYAKAFEGIDMSVPTRVDTPSVDWETVLRIALPVIGIIVIIVALWVWAGLLVG